MTTSKPSMLVMVVLLLAGHVISTSARATLIGVDFANIGAGATPAGWNELFSPPVPTVTNLISESGQITKIGLRYTGAFSGTDGAPVVTSAVPLHSPDLTTMLHDHFFGNGHAAATFNNLIPSAPYHVWIFGGMRIPDFDNLITISGAGAPVRFRQQGNVISFDEVFINSERGSDSRELLSYAEIMSASPQGQIEVSWEAGSSGTNAMWAISGLALQRVPEPSTFVLAGFAILGLACGSRR